MLCVACVEWANLGRFRRVSSTRAGWSCAARARLEGGGGAKKGGRASPRSNPFGGRLRGCGACAGAGRRVAGAGYAVARAGAVIISGRKTKKKGFLPKKNTKNAPRRIRTRPRAFIYRRARVFCLPYGRAGAYIADIMATRAPKSAPKSAAKSATAAELVPVAKRKRGGQIGNRGNRTTGEAKARWGNRNSVGHGRPRIGGDGAEACSVKINLAITPTQRAKLDDAAEKAGVKFADILRNLINAL